MGNITKVNLAATGYGVSYDISGKSPTKPEVEFMLELDQLLFRVSSSFMDVQQRITVIEDVINGVNERLLHTQFDKLQVLQAAQQPILSASRTLKTAYLKSVLKYSRYPLCLGFLMFVIWVICIFNLPRIYAAAAPLEPTFVGAVVNIIGATGFTLVGLTIGTILSIFVTNRRLTIDSFDNIQRYGLPVTIYFGYLYILTAVVLLLLWFKVVVLGIGSITLNQVAERPYFGLLIGLLCGISDSIVADWVIQVVRPARHS